MVQALDCQSKDHSFKSHQLPQEKKKASFFLHLAPNPGPSKIVNWEPGLGWGRTRPLAVPISTEVQVGLSVPTPHCQCSCECLAQLQEFVYIALDPVFSEVAHRGPSLNWSGGGISPLWELVTCLVCVCVCVCVNVLVCV